VGSLKLEKINETSKYLYVVTISLAYKLLLYMYSSPRTKRHPKYFPLLMSYVRDELELLRSTLVYEIFEYSRTSKY